MSIKVASWNILIEGWKTGAKPCLKDVAWEERRDMIVGRVRRMDADVICFQEVDRFNSLAERMAQVGYYGVFAKRNNGQEEGCALFYKHTNVCILKTSHQQEQELYFFSDGTGRMIQKVIIKILSQGSSAPITLLNTHIVNVYSFKDDIEEGFSKRTEELSQLADYAVKSSEGGKPTIVCGDFNVSSEKKDQTYLRKFNECGFKDSFDGSVNSHKPTVLFSTTHQRDPTAVTFRRIDFALSKNILCLESDVRGNPADLDNTKEPSDHLAILCKYMVPEKKELSPREIEKLANQLNQGNVHAAAEILVNIPDEKRLQICQVLAQPLNGIPKVFQ